jgi:hypothetical protein
MDEGIKSRKKSSKEGRAELRKQRETFLKDTSPPKEENFEPKPIKPKETIDENETREQGETSRAFITRPFIPSTLKRPREEEESDSEEIIYPKRQKTPTTSQGFATHYFYDSAKAMGSSLFSFALVIALAIGRQYITSIFVQKAQLPKPPDQKQNLPSHTHINNVPNLPPPRSSIPKITRVDNDFYT